MAKDPAFLFYPGDWLGGTMTFSRAHKGAYMDLLMVQFNDGHMALEDIRTILGADFEIMWESKLKRKFRQDSAGKFFNEKLENEIIKRKKYTESRKNNLLQKKSDMAHHMEAHMENENENKDVIENRNKKKVSAEKSEPAVEIINPHPFSDSFLQHWERWKEYKLSQHKEKYRAVKTEQTAFNHLVKLSAGDEIRAAELIDFSISKLWKGIYDDKTDKQNGKFAGKNGTAAAAISAIANASRAGAKIDWGAFDTTGGSSGMDRKKKPDH